MSKISELSDGGAIQSGDTLIAVRSGGNVKVTYGGTTTANIDGGTIDGTVIGGSSAAAGSFTTISASGEIAANGGVALPDSGQATFGAGDDLKIYHTGSHSYIDENGTGNLYIGSNNGGGVYIQGSGENLASFIDDGAVTLYYDNASKLATTATGIDVTGTVTADGLTLDGNSYTTGNTEYNTGHTYFYSNREVRFFNTANNNWAKIQNPSTVGDLRITVGGGAGALFANNGDISFYEDTGTTAKFFWDASAESLGIGTSSPVAIGGYSSLTMNNTTGTFAEFQEAGTNRLRIGGDNGSAFINGSSGTLRLLTSDIERMRIDSSGNLLVGKTATGIGTAGVELAQGGYIYGTRNGNSLALNRLTTDGDLAVFQKDGTTVGSISVTASTTAYNITSDERLKENIVDTTHTVDINDIKVRQYDWKSNGEHQRYGFIAQELEAVYPEAVFSPEDPEEMKAVDYSKLVPLLVKEIQDLKAEVAALKGA